MKGENTPQRNTELQDDDGEVFKIHCQVLQNSKPLIQNYLCLKGSIFNSLEIVPEVELSHKT